MRNYRRTARSSSMILQACAVPSPLAASGKTGAGKRTTLWHKPQLAHTHNCRVN